MPTDMYRDLPWRIIRLCFPEILIVFVWDWGPGFRDYLRRDCAHVDELGFLKVKLQIGTKSYVFKEKVKFN